MNNHTEIRLRIIAATYTAISHLEGVLSAPILEGQADDLSPDKFMNAVKAKKQAQTDAFDMLLNIERAQNEIDSQSKEISKKQQRVNKSSKGFAENNAK